MVIKKKYRVRDNYKTNVNPNYLSADEYKVLHSKYKKKGFDSQEAYDAVNKIKKHLKELIEVNKKLKFDKEKINEKFQREFEKLYQMAEAGQVLK